jgi:N-dimethylarginine dimethylaminohydrolase
VTKNWLVSSETGVLTDVLLCQPDHYDYIPTNTIARETIASGARIDRQALFAQYRELEEALSGAEVRLHFLKPEPHLPYQVYTRDSSQVTPWGAVVTQLFRPQRRGEYAAILDFYNASDGGPWGYSTAGTLEGGDIHIIRPGLLAVGHSGERTDETGARQFSSLFERQGWEVHLVAFAEHFLHLDVIFSMVADGIALACPEVLDDGFLAWLGKHQIRVIPVSYRETMHDMACNVLALGQGRVVSPRHSRRVNEALRAEGLTVIDPELSLFSAGGGSVHCMTMPLRRIGV